MHMENFPLENTKSPDNNDGLIGREAIPVDSALSAQIELVKYMMLDKLTPHLEGNKAEENLDKLTEIWLDKYAGKFAEFCDENADDADLMERIIQKNLTNEDFMAIRAYLEEASGVFMAGEEPEKFITENLQ